MSCKHREKYGNIGKQGRRKGARIVKKNTAIRRLAVAGVVSASIATSFQLYSQHQEIQMLQDDHKKLQSAKNVLSTEVNVLHKENKSLKIDLQEANQHAKDLQKNADDLQEKVNDLQNDNQQLKKANQSLKDELKSKNEVLPSRKQVSNDDDSWVSFIATYYDANEPSTGKHPGDPAYGLTASGENVQAGVTIAVDPNVIPLGSWVLLKYPDGRVEKRQAQDTGSAIKGNHVDIYLPHASISSGKHEVQVKILGKE